MDSPEERIRNPEHGSIRVAIHGYNAPAFSMGVVDGMVKVTAAAGTMPSIRDIHAGDQITIRFDSDGRHFRFTSLVTTPFGGKGVSLIGDILTITVGMPKRLEERRQRRGAHSITRATAADLMMRDPPQQPGIPPFLFVTGFAVLVIIGLYVFT